MAARAIMPIMEKTPERAGAPEVELESIHLLKAIDSLSPWLAGELDGSTRELLLALSFEEALGYVGTVIVAGGRNIDKCLNKVLDAL